MRVSKSTLSQVEITSRPSIGATYSNQMSFQICSDPKVEHSLSSGPSVVAPAVEEMNTVGQGERTVATVVLGSGLGMERRKRQQSEQTEEHDQSWRQRQQRSETVRC